MSFEINDYNFNRAIDRLLRMIKGSYKDKVGLAIHIISNESGFSIKELSHHLYKLKIIKQTRNHNYNKVFYEDKNNKNIYRGGN